MKVELIEGLICPATRKPLKLRDEKIVDGVVMEGTLVSSGGRYRYPIRDGAAFVAVMDHAWGTILKELINRREIIEENLKNPPEPSPAPTGSRKEEQDAAVSGLAEICFQEALDHMPGDRPLRVIDCGAGMFETSSHMAQQGMDVVATDTEISMIRYANFQGNHKGDPQPFEINGRPYYIRDPEGHPSYFSRVMCDIQRLPFMDGFFDVAFCRAMLHHTDRPGDAIREMARLVRPGGMIVITAEFFRSALDREFDYHEETVDREEGMNERAPSILDYRLPLGRVGREIRLQYWPTKPMGRTKNLFDKIGWNHERRLWAGEELSNWKWMKLLPWAGGVNFYATRNRAEVMKPAKVNDSDIKSVEEVVDVYTAYDDVKTIEGLREGTEQLKEIRRKILSRISEEFPAGIKVGHTQGMVLESGWGRVETDEEGRRFRYVHRRAAIPMRSPAIASKIAIVHGGGADGFVYTTEVRVNGQKVGELKGKGPKRRRSTFEIPEAREQNRETVIHVEFISHIVTEHKEARAEVGAGIYTIKVK